jgi:YHS domain-containing protein
MIMKTTTKALLVLALFGGALLAQPSTQESKKPVNTKCPVMPQEAVDPKSTLEYKGKLIGFCCQDCIPEFKKDPEKYVKDLK